MSQASQSQIQDTSISPLVTSGNVDVEIEAEEVTLFDAPVIIKEMSKDEIKMPLVVTPPWPSGAATTDLSARHGSTERVMQQETDALRPTAER